MRLQAALGPGHLEVSGDPEVSGLGGKKGPDTYMEWTEGEEGVGGVRVHCLATYFAVKEGGMGSQIGLLKVGVGRRVWVELDWNELKV